MPVQAQARAPRQPYRWLAEFYDELFDSFRTPINAAREKLLAEILPRTHSACDLACGTGTTALSLARRGISVYAVDLSPTMCELAHEKASRERLPVQVIRDDMRTFRLSHRVDLVTCESDALNHLPRRSDLDRVARSVARALTPGGYFFFDVNNLKGFRRYWNGTVWMEKPDVVVVMRNGHDISARKAWSDVEWFVQQDKLWSRHHEYVEEVCWDRKEIRAALMKAGFNRVWQWDAAPYYKNNPMISAGCRTIFLACFRQK